MESMDTRLISGVVKPLLSSMGYELVEVKLGRTRNLDAVTVVIYKPGGVSLDDCVQVSRNLRPRLDLLEEFGNIALTVTSPGISRILKSDEEYRIFKGRGIKILLKDNSEWSGGILLGTDGSKISLETRAGITDIDLSHIKKAKLDFAEEGNDK